MNMVEFERIAVKFMKYKRKCIESGRMGRYVGLQIALLLLAAGLTTTARSQQLYRQNSGTTDTLFTIAMMDDSNGITAGRSQFVAITTNGGERWASSRLQGLENYYCSYYNDTSSGAIGGTNGFLLCKRPGRGPSQIVLPERKDIHGITFPTSDDNGNPRDLLCVGDAGLIYRSGDSGKNWSKVAPPVAAATRDFYGTTYWNDSTWWVVGSNGIILYTDDAGAHWQTIESPSKHALRSICFPLDAQNGWIVGDSTLLLTTDYGDTWQSIPVAVNLHFVDGYDSTGFAVGENGTLLATNDLTHWITIPTGTSASLYGMSVMSDLYIVGDSGIILTSKLQEENSVAEDHPMSSHYDLTCDGTTLKVLKDVQFPFRLRLYDLLGVEVESLMIQDKVNSLPKPLPTGAYLYRASDGEVGKLLVR